ncbi:hypothetical protein BBJ28_00001352 [Nothophytophthora sp. Chile5]|nr:hypothetical protein BBJ28_00001352 [Nothophytophthora sp. Chile5]
MATPAKMEGAVPKKVYMHYDEGDETLHLTLKMTLPSKWAGHTVDYLKEVGSSAIRAALECSGTEADAEQLLMWLWLAGQFFVEHYNKKKPENVVDGAHMHLEKKANVVLYGDELLHTAVQKYDDVFLKAGASTMKPVRAESKDLETSSRFGWVVWCVPVLISRLLPANCCCVITESAAPGSAGKSLLQCKNHGCQQKFLETENHDQACRHHSQPPMFHDMKKGWQCCSTKMVYDWDDFEKIEPCVVGRHSAVGPNEQFAASPTVAAAESAASAAGSSVPAAPPSLKSIDDYNEKNPNAVTAVSAAVDNQQAPPPVRTDGKAHCVNFGCQQEYVVSENTESSCRHHTGAPVFHDAGKFWSCCPKSVKYDFDSFLKLPGCAVSAHTNVKTA